MPDKKVDVRGKVAVITGAASGIGLALALHAADKGMHVALADMDSQGLKSAELAVTTKGVKAVTVQTDVRMLEQVQKLKDITTQVLGKPWLIVNNAGITKIALTWKHTEADWKRMFDINVGGVINGLLTFLPDLIEQKDGYVVNTASVAGLLTVPASAAYVGSKHAVVGISETLYRDLQADSTGVGVSVLCPGLVKTNILKSAQAEGAKPSAAMDSAHALEPSDVARQVFEAIEARRFWILTHAKQMDPHVRARTDQELSQTNPDARSIDPDAAESMGRAVGLNYLRQEAGV